MERSNLVSLQSSDEEAYSHRANDIMPLGLNLKLNGFSEACGF